MKLVENPQVTQPNQSQVIKVKSVQSFRGVFKAQLKILFFELEKTLRRRCSTGSSLPTFLKFQ